MSTTYITKTNVKMCIPDHFLPCVRGIRKTVPAKSNMTFQSGSKKKCIGLLFQLSEEKERSWEASNEEEEKISSAKNSKKFETIIYPSEYYHIFSRYEAVWNTLDNITYNCCICNIYGDICITVKCIGTSNWPKCVLIVLSVSSPEKCF